MDKQEVKYNEKLHYKLVFCENFRTSCCISPTIFEKLTILPEIWQFFLKFGKIRQLVRKRSQKINCDVILNYISLSIYPLHFSKFCPIQKQQKTLRNCRYLVKTTLAVNQIIYKRIFFETLVIFLESTIKLITGIFDFQK